MKGLSDVNETCTIAPLPWHEVLENYLTKQLHLKKSYDRLTDLRQPITIYYNLQNTANRQHVVAQWLSDGDIQRLHDVITIPDVGSIPLESRFF